MLCSNRVVTILFVMLLLSACQPISMPAASNTDSTSVVQHLQAAYSAGDVAGLTDIMAPDVIVHMPPLPDMVGIDAYRAAIADLRNALPNANLTFNAVDATGAGITARYTITGTHTGPSVAFGPPTGKAVTLAGVMVAQMQAGQISELWDYADRFGLSLQLDQALPPPPTFVALNESAPTEPSTLDPALIGEIETLIKQIMQERNLPGLAVGIVMNGAVAYVNGFGVADIESGRPVTVRTLFELGSISKQFTATAIMQLVEQGKINLDDPLITYLPYFELNDPRYKEITIHQMLSHTSGLPALEIDSMLDYARGLTPEYDEDSAARMVRSLANLELQFAPGEGYGYSDIAFNILGTVVATVSGQSFEDYVRDHIFLPLGMNSSTFELRAVDPTLLARPHITSAEGKVQKPDIFPYMRSNAPSSHPYISTNDMVRWLLANLNDGELDGMRILQPETHQTMWRIHAPETGMREFMPEWASYGFGWMIGTLGEEASASHGGADLGYVALDYLFPAKNIGIVIMTNRDDTFDDAFGTAMALQPIVKKVAGVAE